MLTKNDVIQKAIDLFEGNESAALNWCKVGFSLKLNRV